MSNAFRTPARTWLGSALACLFVVSGITAQPFVYREAHPFLPTPGPAPTGWLIRSANDLNGDGWTEVGVTWKPIPRTFRVHSGQDFAVLFEKQGALLPLVPVEYERVGEGFDFADMDGNGLEDLILGTAPDLQGGAVGSGRVEVFSMPSGSLIYTVTGEQQWDGFGGIVEAVGDTNGNGVPDFLVKAGGVDAPPIYNVGKIYLIEGADGSILHSYLGQYPTDQDVLAKMGDIDQDGLADFAIARSAAAAIYGVAGYVRIYSGASPSSVIREHTGNITDVGHCQKALMSMGDADGDGIPEYLIGNMYYGGSGSPTAAGPGRAWLFSGATGAILQTYVPPALTTYLGFRATRFEDLDGDGYPEIGLYGAVSSGTGTALATIFLYDGAGGGLIQSIPSLSSTQQLWSFAGLADGKNSLVVGRYAGAVVDVYDRGWVSVTPNPVPIATTADFDVDLLSDAGALFHLFFATSAVSGIPLGSRAFPLDPDVVMLSSAEWPSLNAILDASGAAAIPISVPSDPALVGATLWFAGATFDAAYPFAVRSMSTARSVTIQ